MPDLSLPSPKKAWLFALLWCLSATIHAGADTSLNDTSEQIIWRKAPIGILLAAGEERLVHFPDSVRLGLPRSLASTRCRAQSIHGTLYLQARESFRGRPGSWPTRSPRDRSTCWTLRRVGAGRKPACAAGYRGDPRACSGRTA